MADDDHPDAEGDGDGASVGPQVANPQVESSGRRARGSARRILAGVLVAGLVAAVTLALVQRGQAQDYRHDLGERDDVARAAATFGEVYLSYDFDDPDGSGDRVVELVSPEFAADFTSTRAPGIEELFANLKTTTVATTSEVFVGDVDGESARALVVVDVVADSAAAGKQELKDLSFVLDLVRVDGAWLVDQVTPAPQPDLSGDGVEQPGSSTTTTTTATDATTTTAAP